MVDSFDVGGTETQMAQIACRLAQRGHHITVAPLRGGGPLEEPLRKAGIQIVPFPKRRRIFSFQGIFQMMRMAWFIRREKFDVVHAHDLWSNLMAVPAARLACAPVILVSQRNLAHIPWYTPFRRKVVRFLYALSDGVIVNSDAIRELLVKEFHVAPNLVHVLHNGVDLERFVNTRGDRREILPSIPSNGKWILHIANLNSEVKGHAVLIEAARIISAAFADVHFIFVGDGSLRARLEDQVHEAKLESCVHFVGRRSDVADLLSCGDLFVFPSLAEGLPNALLEAAAAGLAIVATTIGGIPEIIENNLNGILIPPGDSQALANASLRLLKDREISERFGRAAQQTMQAKFGFEQLADALTRLYISPR
ncbi:MAG: glycosyltransferase [Candidatus Dormibacteria bacterium]